MRAFNLGAVRRALYASAVLTLLSVPSLAQVVEKGRTFADLTASHPCDTGLTERIARVTDCDAADDVGDGEGLFQCWVRCDGTAPWETVAIGGGAGGGSGDVVGPASAIDGQVAVQSGTTGKLLANSGLIAAATTGNLQWEGTTADAFEGNFTFADPTADWTWAWGADGTLTGATQLNLENLRLDGNTLSTTNTNGNLVLAPNGTGSVLVPAGAAMSTPGILFDNNQAIWARGGGYLAIGSNTTQYVELSAFGVQALEGGSISWFPSGGPSTTNTAMKRAANGIVAFSDGSTGGGAIHLNPFASPPRTCDATAEGDIYSDTSHALCWCDATTWQKLSGAGTCA